jgi:hypothetical protein
MGKECANGKQWARTCTVITLLGIRQEDRIGVAVLPMTRTIGGREVEGGLKTKRAAILLAARFGRCRAEILLC